MALAAFHINMKRFEVGIKTVTSTPVVVKQPVARSRSSEPKHDYIDGQSKAKNLKMVFPQDKAVVVALRDGNITSAVASFLLVTERGMVAQLFKAMKAIVTLSSFWSGISVYPRHAYTFNTMVRRLPIHTAIESVHINPEIYNIDDSVTGSEASKLKLVENMRVLLHRRCQPDTIKIQHAEEDKDEVKTFIGPINRPKGKHAVRNLCIDVRPFYGSNIYYGAVSQVRIDACPIFKTQLQLVMDMISNIKTHLTLSIPGDPFLILCNIFREMEFPAKHTHFAPTRLTILNIDSCVNGSVMTSCPVLPSVKHFTLIRNHDHADVSFSEYLGRLFRILPNLENLRIASKGARPVYARAAIRLDIPYHSKIQHIELFNRFMTIGSCKLAVNYYPSPSIVPIRHHNSPTQRPHIAHWDRDHYEQKFAYVGYAGDTYSMIQSPTLQRHMERYPIRDYHRDVNTLTRFTNLIGRALALD